MFFPETWRDGRGAGLGIGAGTQRFTFKTPTKHSGGNDKEICYEFQFRREIWAGVRDMTSHMYVWPQSMEMDEIISPQPFSVPVLDEIEPKCLITPCVLLELRNLGENVMEWCLGLEPGVLYHVKSEEVRQSRSNLWNRKNPREEKSFKDKKGSNGSATCRKVKMNMIFVFGNLEVISDLGE